jgi:PAS domain S-box-containing protein
MKVPHPLGIAYHEGMLFAFPAVLAELGLWVGSLTAFLVLMTMLWKLGLLKKLWANNISNPLGGWLAALVLVVTEEEREENKKFRSYVRGHMGPNGTAPPLHERIKAVEAASVVSAERQRHFMDDLEVGITESDENGECIFINRVVCELFECQPEDWYGEGWKNFLDPSSRQAEVERFVQSMHRGAENPGHVISMQTKSGTPLVVEGMSYPLKSLNGRVVGYIGEMVPLPSTVPPPVPPISAEGLG